MKYAIIFLLLSALLSSAHAQQTANADTLAGLIVNHKNKAIRNVPVTAKHKDGVFKTDRRGIFVIPDVSLHDTLTMIIPKNRIFVIPASGMAFLKIIFNENMTITEAMEAKDEIVELGYGQTRRSRNSSGSAVISGEELRQTGQTDI